MSQTMTNPTAKSPSAIFDYGKWRNEFLRAILIGASIFGFIALAANFITGANTSDLIAYSAAFVILLLTTLIPFPYWLKAMVFLVLVYALGISGFLDTGLWGDSRVFMLALVIMACLLFSPLAGIISTIIGTLTTIGFGWLILSSRYQPITRTMSSGTFTDWLTGILINILLAVVVIIGLRLVQKEFERTREQAGSALQKSQEEGKNLELHVQELTDQLSRKSDLLRSSALITRRVAELQDVPTILESAVHWASDLFGFYHVAIYLFDDQRRIAFLQAASTDVGKKLVEDGVYIESDPKNVIGYISEQNKSYILTEANDENKTRLQSEGKLELTRSEIVIPLTVRGKIAGVIDFQSKESFTFDQDEIEILQSLADQIAISIDSARLLDETQAFVNELEAVTTQQMGDVWKRYLVNRALAYQYTASGVKSITPDQVKTKNKKDMQIPLRLRGQDIGMIAFRSKENVRWTASVRELAEKVANQVALALDNSRLLEETRRRATQQQTVNEISTRLNRFLDFDTLLQTAARELGSLPDVAEVSVFVGEAEEQDTKLNRGT